MRVYRVHILDPSFIGGQVSLRHCQDCTSYRDSRFTSDGVHEELRETRKLDSGAGECTGYT